MNEIKYLRIGDKSVDGKYEIIDEDRLCYKIKMPKGTVAIADKVCYMEFLEYADTHRDENAKSMGDALNGKSDVDPFTYGYSAMYRNLALMTLDESLVVRNKDIQANTITKRNSITPLPLQQIYYGAPGTGKSHEINTLTKGHAVVRTTFHPDSDYSTFVGAYKPVMEEMDVRVTPVVINNGISMDQNNGTYMEKRITYRFVKQAFMKAYLGAWRKYAEAQISDDPSKIEPQYLVIEEINRGNCAQIFGDLFQLLDREDNGFSSYPIEADTDLQQEVARAFVEDEDYMFAEINVDSAVDGYTSNYGCTLSDDIINGRVLLLPPNLYIWATMNTSDQSLFPIDSAFKRRWDWKYMPINTEKESWSVEVNGVSYSWSSFLQIINKEIFDTTSSEDKQLGFYFCKAKNGKINADKFVSKVLFYLYNDVFKDYGLEREFFKDKEDGNKVISFQSLYDSLTGKVDEKRVEKLLVNLGVQVIEIKETENIDEVEEIESEGEGAESGSRRILHVVFDDETIAIKRFPQYLQVVKKIGLEKVYTVASEKSVNVLGCALVSREREQAIEDSNEFSYVQEGEFYVVKGIKGRVMQDLLPLVSERYGLNLKVEYR